MSSPVRPVDVTRVSSAGSTHARDVAAAEEPLEIRLNGSTFVVTMRTPGADRGLTAGLLLSERIVSGAADLASLTETSANTIDVVLTGDASARAQQALAARRLVTTTSACGVCGRQSIEDLMTAIVPVTERWSMPAAVVLSLPGRLRTAQATFDETGGLHAAALFDSAGTLVAAAEDVGRHNAVDKVIGAQLLAGRFPLGDRALMVSGRTSFEIVQKAVVAGIPIVAAVSAPSSLAIDLARQTSLTLLGFVRGDTFNIYAGAERISGPPRRGSTRSRTPR